MVVDNKKDISSREISILSEKKGKYNRKLFAAVQRGYISEITDLLNKGAEINAKDGSGRTPLHTANDKSIARLLIGKGADIYAKDNNGKTPLHTANDKSIAKLLIGKGADINAKDYDGQTPLHTANDESIAKLLIDKGADINAKDYHGQTPFQVALEHQKTGVVNFLAKANDKYGKTMLHYAAKDSNLDLVRLLIDKGAEIYAKIIMVRRLCTQLLMRA